MEFTLLIVSAALIVAFWTILFISGIPEPPNEKMKLAIQLGILVAGITCCTIAIAQLTNQNTSELAPTRIPHPF